MDSIANEDLRFRFGKNWTNFLTTIDESRIKRAENSLKALLKIDSLSSKSFLDIGSGSGLFSLAARRLGASVSSFDYDLDSVNCTLAMRQKYLKDDPNWKIQRGSILDHEFLKSLGTFDVVYSWGVLHHSGNMWRAFELVVPLVKKGGVLAIAIYNDQGALSRIWTRIKQLYNRLPKLLRPLLVGLVALLSETAVALSRIITLRNPLPFERWSAARHERGMSIWYDYVDWVGGYPFEVAKPEQVFEYFRARGFILNGLRTKAAGQGCCEYLFLLPE